MISLDDCCAFCGISESAVLAIAEHEHIPALSAAGLAQHLLCQPDGCRVIGGMIADDYCSAVEHGDRRHADEMRALLREFVASNPGALASRRARACLAVGA